MSTRKPAPSPEVPSLVAKVKSSGLLLLPARLMTTESQLRLKLSVSSANMGTKALDSPIKKKAGKEKSPRAAAVPIDSEEAEKAIRFHPNLQKWKNRGMKFWAINRRLKDLVVERDTCGGKSWSQCQKTARTGRQNNYLFKAQNASFVAHEEKYIANKGKAFALIYGQCNKALQHKLQAWKDFKDVIKSNPIKLLDAISEHSLSYMENKYPFSTGLDAIKNYINLKQCQETRNTGVSYLLQLQGGQ